MDGSAPPASGQGVLALEGWEQPPRRQPRPAAAPVLTVDGFEGPLDWPTGCSISHAPGASTWPGCPLRPWWKRSRRR